MPGIEKGFACIGIWLACSSIVFATTNPQNRVSELLSENNSATRTARSSVSITHHLGPGSTSNSQRERRSIFINSKIGEGQTIHIYRDIEKGNKETGLSEVSRSPPQTEDQSSKVAAVLDGFRVQSSNFIDRLEELTNGSITTTQELRSSWDQMSARIASIDRSLAEIAELTNKTLSRSEQILSAYNSTRTQLNETESALCPVSTSGFLASGSKGVPNDCLEIYQSGYNVSGIYKIRPRMSSVDAFSVYCEMDAHGGGWTVLQARKDGLLSFYQRWYKYRDGFGSLDGEFWLGLERIHQLTNSKRYELLIEIEDFYGETRFALYDNFFVSSEEEKYSLHKLGSYTGNAGDSLSYHLGQRFSTWDQDNDPRSGENCAMSHGGGWWMHDCATSTLNGHYLGGQFKLGYLRAGIEWDTWRGVEYSYKKSRMSIRPVNADDATQSELS